MCSETWVEVSLFNFYRWLAVAILVTFVLGLPCWMLWTLTRQSGLNQKSGLNWESTLHRTATSSPGRVDRSSAWFKVARLVARMMHSLFPLKRAPRSPKLRNSRTRTVWETTVAELHDHAITTTVQGRNVSCPRFAHSLSVISPGPLPGGATQTYTLSMDRFPGVR